MKTLNALAIAQNVIADRTGDAGIVLLELHNGGGSQNWGRQFPSLSDDQLDMIDETAFMQCDSAREARDLFQRLTLDCAENGTGGLIGGTITLVVRDECESDDVETLAWDLDSKTRPVFEDGDWRDDLIVDRI